MLAFVVSSESGAATEPDTQWPRLNRLSHLAKVHDWMTLSVIFGANTRPRFGRSILLLACMSLSGCFSFGSIAISLIILRHWENAEKSATLLNVVRLRYADSPTILQATQVVTGYDLQGNVTGGFELFPAANPSTYLAGTASAQVEQHPTFTFQPLSGEQFAETFIRPLSPAEILPLVISGMPIDVLFRLSVQSINGVTNTVWLAQSNNAGSPDFFLLLQDLRRLQIAGLLVVRLQQHKGGATEPHNKSAPDHVYLSISPTRNPDLQRTVVEVKRLLGMPQGVSEEEVIYGVTAQPGKVTILTRPMLGVLGQLAIQIDVPPEDIERHLTLPSVGNVGLERRPVVVIHSGVSAPADVFVSVQYRGTWFWIAVDDFDSKNSL